MDASWTWRAGPGGALVPMRAAVGPAGQVIGLDLTPEMLAEVARRGLAQHAHLVRGDTNALPLASDSIDAIFAAGILHHLRDPVAALLEFARVSVPHARRALFHPAAAQLSRRHNRHIDPEDVMGPAGIAAALSAAGWRCLAVDDAAARYLALASRCDPYQHERCASPGDGLWDAIGGAVKCVTACPQAWVRGYRHVRRGFGFEDAVDGVASALPASFVTM